MFRPVKDEAPPAPLALATDALAGYRRRWFLCGGWAVDAWLGQQTRPHLDVDIAVFHDDQSVLFEHLSGWKLLGHDDNVAEDCPDQWDGRSLDMPGHIHASIEKMNGIELDIQLNQSVHDDWFVNCRPGLTLPLDRCIARCAWGLPIVTPELVLFYKAHPPTWRDAPRPAQRPKDEHDFQALLPTLEGRQRSWLGQAISLVDPTHHWLGQLGA